MTSFYLLLFAFALAALAFILLPIFRAATPHRGSFALWITLFFLCTAFGMYGWIGSPTILAAITQRDAKLAQLRDSMTQNSERIKKNDKDLAAWVALGQDFIETGQFSAARNAFRRAVLLSGGEAPLILAYAKAMILEADGKVTDDAKKALQMVKLQQPENADMRYFMALRLLQEGKMPEAMKEMKALYKSLPDDSPLKAAIDKQIGRK